MSKQEYLRALNAEIQRLNQVIDYKVMHQDNYRKEARRHKELLRQIRREERRRSLGWMLPRNLFRNVN